MNRKDVILIAVFVNSALLITLFISAIKQEEKSSGVTSVLSSVALPKEHTEVHTIPFPNTLLTEGPKTIGISEKEESLPSKMGETTVSESFAKELEAITKVASLSSKESQAKEMQVKEEKQIIVQKGDTLEKIARANHVSVEKIFSYNHLNNSMLRIGQVLKIPFDRRTSAKEVESPSSEFSQDRYYVVKTGDNLWAIANKNQMKLKDLLVLNHLDEETAKRLRPGDKLRIR